MSTLDLSQYRTPAPLLSRAEWEKKLGHERGRLIDLIHARQQRITDEGFPIITQECLDELIRFIGNNSVFEVGAGTGYLARLLYDRSVKIHAVDSRDGEYTRDQWWESDFVSYFPVEKQDVTKLAVIPGDIVLMSWPCYDSDYAYSVAKLLLPGQILLYQGESKGGCCANNLFFDYLSNSRRFARSELDDLNEVHISDYDVYDHWTAWLTVR